MQHPSLGIPGPSTGITLPGLLTIVVVTPNPSGARIRCSGIVSHPRAQTHHVATWRKHPIFSPMQDGHTLRNPNVRGAQDRTLVDRMRSQHPHLTGVLWHAICLSRARLPHTHLQATIALCGRAIAGLDQGTLGGCTMGRHLRTSGCHLLLCVICATLLHEATL